MSDESTITNTLDSDQEPRFAYEGLDETPLVYATDVSIAVDQFGLHFVFGQFSPPPFVSEADRVRNRERG